ncbi:MAG: DUF456 domain-containing protein [Eubacteriales bacterium]|nr:DUF456 domain-containing protein [Eubacteriales bacterium]
MTVTIVLTIIAILALVFALIGIIIPGMPSIQALWVLVAIDYWFLGYLELSGKTMIILSLAAAFTVIGDYVTTSMGVKKRGGSTLGAIGSVVGLIAGLALFQLPGMLIGCFLGALAGELLHGQEVRKAAYIAVGALFGYAASAAIQFAIWGLYAAVIFYHIYA